MARQLNLQENGCQLYSPPAAAYFVKLLQKASHVGINESETVEIAA